MQGPKVMKSRVRAVLPCWALSRRNVREKSGKDFASPDSHLQDQKKKRHAPKHAQNEAKSSGLLICPDNQNTVHKFFFGRTAPTSARCLKPYQTKPFNNPLAPP
jgi:hypothetical protein